MSMASEPDMTAPTANNLKAEKSQPLTPKQPDPKMERKASLKLEMRPPSVQKTTYIAPVALPVDRSTNGPG